VNSFNNLLSVKEAAKFANVNERRIRTAIISREFQGCFRSYNGNWNIPLRQLQLWMERGVEPSKAKGKASFCPIGFMPIEKVATRLGCSIALVRSMHAKGLFPNAIKETPSKSSRIFYSVADVEANCIQMEA